MSKQGNRRKLGMLRAEFHSAPWSIDVRALGMLSSALETGDIETVKATLALGQDSCESIVKMVNGIAVIPVTGVLCDEVNFMVRWGWASSYQQIERDFKAAIGNSQVKGVLFYFDTPGGSAIGCKRVSDIIFEARGSKPIRAFTQKMCGSAGFYMMAACDRSEATADALVGSIGTIYTHLEMSKLLKDIGYSAEVITNSGSPKKGHGNMYEPLSDAARKTLQQYVESYGQPFINDVARYRGISAEKVSANYGQGDAIRADVAVNQGIIDGIVGGFEESLEAITLAAGNGPAAKTNTPGVSGATSVARVALSPLTAAPPPDSGNAAVKGSSTMSKRLKAQLFAFGLIDSIDASDEVCKAALAAFFAGRGTSQPADDAKCLAALQSKVKLRASDETEEDPEDEDDTEKDETTPKRTSRRQNHARRQVEGRQEGAGRRAGRSPPRRSHALPPIL
jgi:ClpP class serine protease